MGKINIAELLKDCPTGMELDCTIFGTKVIYQKIYKTASYPIVVQTEHGFEFRLTQYGQIHNIVGAECVIFPKGKTTWEGFYRPFKDGDILATILGSIFIYRKIDVYNYCGSYVSLDIHNGFLSTYHSYLEDCSRLAIKEEKQKLFDAIKANGYKWNAETKTLEKLPKFKVGDVIVDIYKKHLHCDSGSGKISQITDDKYIFTDGSYIHIQDQDNWGISPNKFNITTLKPFESMVLVRDTDTDAWKGAFYSHYKSKKFYTIGSSYYYQCIPYEGNQHLLDTTNDCDDFYKTWEK